MKVHIVNTMQNLTSQLIKRVSRSQMYIPQTHSTCESRLVILFLSSPPQDPMNLTNADNAFTLYYVKYRAAAPKVRVSTSIFCILTLCVDKENDTCLLSVTD